MTLKGKSVNLQALAECVCYLLFGGLLFGLTYSGRYLAFVAPRMKPYLYGLSALMFLWAAEEGRLLLTPRYKAKLARLFVFMIPILLLIIRPAAPGGSSMISNYNPSGMSVAAGNNKMQPTGGPEGGGSPVPSTKESSDSDSEADGDSETDGYPEETEGNSDEEESPKYDLDGLDEASKTITIGDDDYYNWMYELSNHYEKYEGWTVIMKGFVYRDKEIPAKYDFALVRLSMWCCAADLSPIGFLVENDGKGDFKDDAWVTVKGTLGMTEDGSSIVLKAQSIKAAEKPKEEYVYPF